MSNSFNRPIDQTLSGETIPGQSGPGNDGSEEVLHIPQSFKIGASPSDYLMSYPGHFIGGGLTPQQRYSCCILQPQPTWLKAKLSK